MMKPIFQGTSEHDQLFKIVSVLGPPSAMTWPDGMKLANRLGIRMPQNAPVALSTLMPNASPAAIELMTEMFRYDPSKRPSCAQALQHRFFKEGERIPPVNRKRSVPSFTKPKEPKDASPPAKSSLISAFEHQSPRYERPKFGQTMHELPMENSFEPQNPINPLQSYLRSMQTLDRYEPSHQQSNPFELPSSNTNSPLRGLSNHHGNAMRIKAVQQPILKGLRPSGLGAKPFQATPMAGPIYRPPLEGSKSAKPEFRIDDDLFSDLF